MQSESIKYSIIIPTLNEADYIGQLLSDLCNQSVSLHYNVEIIIVDGGSADDTVDICKGYEIKILHSKKGRGTQLKKGTDNSVGQYLIFLHSDIKLPNNFFQNLDHNINDSFIISTFVLKFDSDKFLYKCYSLFTHIDSVFTTFGDQGIIVSREFYFDIGGFKDIPIMEDIDFLRRVRKFTPIKKIKIPIVVSIRRFKRVGIIKTQFLSAILIIKYFLGIHPEILYQQYYKNNADRKRDNRFCEISRTRESKNKISLINE